MFYSVYSVYFWCRIYHITETEEVTEDVRKQERVEEDLQLTSGKNKFGKQNQLRSRSSVLVKLKWNWTADISVSVSTFAVLSCCLTVKLFSDIMPAHRARLPLQIRRKLQTFVRYFVLFSLSMVVLIEGYR